MIKHVTLLLFIGLVFWSCEDAKEDHSCLSHCGLEISSTLPLSNGIYQLEFNDGEFIGGQTYETLTAETNCGIHQHLLWDSNYQIQIGSDWVSLVNPSSMTDQDGNANVILSVWDVFIGDTITVYCGYTDDCGNHHLDSLFVKVNADG